MGVAPRAREASSYSCGTASNAVTDTLIMETAVYLAKLAPPKVKAVVESAVSLLAGIPSGVYGTPSSPP